MKVFRTSQLGFTLIEMIVSLAVFSVVITISVGALLMLIASNGQLQNEQSVMTNLSFALDSMAREIRTGTNYYCDRSPNRTSGTNNIFKDGNSLDGILGTSVKDCPKGNSPSANNTNPGQVINGISFKEGGNSITGTNERILYFYDADVGKIFRRVGTQAAQSIVSSGIYIEKAEFFVSGSSPLSAAPSGNTNGYVDQSAVTIFIEAKDVKDSTGKLYRIQTTITQRTLDI